MKNFGFLTLLFALLTPVVSGRLTLLRLAQGDQNLRGLSAVRPTSVETEHKTVMRELFDFWEGEAMVSISMSAYEPEPVEIPDFGFDFYNSMSMSMPPTLPEDIQPWWDLESSLSYSMPAEYVPDDVGTVGSTTEDKSDETAAENLGDQPVAESPPSSSNLGAALLVVLVVAAMAILSAWYVRKNQRASSNASLMTPVSTNPIS